MRHRIRRRKTEDSRSIQIVPWYPQCVAGPVRLLLIHQNFPGQFRHLAAGLAARGHELIGIGSAADPELPVGMLYGAYAEPEPAVGCVDPDLEAAFSRAERVLQVCQALEREAGRPDAVILHSGWGEGLYLRDLWPDVPLVTYPELYGSPLLLGFGFDSSLGPMPASLPGRLRRHNLLSLAALQDSDAVICPTRFQRDTFPSPLRERIEVIHEGVDLEALAPSPGRCVDLGEGLMLRAGDPVVTFCSRHLEPLRGFHTFMRALPALQRAHPDVRVLIVGENSPGYGPASPHPGGHRGALLEELEGRLDLDRIHFLERIPHSHLLALDQITAAHVYLTYPYALSWSCLEAMACGAAVVGSRSAPVEEAIRHGESGLLVEFNEPPQLAAALLELLQRPQLRARLGAGARRRIEETYGLQASLEAYERLLSRLVDARATR